MVYGIKSFRIQYIFERTLIYFNIVYGLIQQGQKESPLVFSIWLVVKIMVPLSCLDPLGWYTVYSTESM